MSTVADLPASAEWLHEQTTFEEDWYSGRAEASWYVPWADWKAFRDAVAGINQTFTITAGGLTYTYTRKIPLQFPWLTNSPLYAFNYQMRGDGASRLADDGHSIEYDWAFFRVQFQTPPWQMDGPYPLVTFSQETSADGTTRPGSAYVFPSDGLPLAQPTTVRVPVSDFTLTFHQCPQFNQGVFDSLAGCVNSTTFYGKAPGTVQYVGPATNGVSYSNGGSTWTITHRFRWRTIPHNVIMRPDGAGFEAPVQAGDTSQGIIPAAELNSLWFA